MMHMMVTHHPQDGHPLTVGSTPNNLRRVTTVLRTITDHPKTQDGQQEVEFDSSAAYLVVIIFHYFFPFPLITFSHVRTARILFLHR